MPSRPWMNYHHLLYFKMIATEGGIAGAAMKLRLGQPTLSTQLKQFEDAIGHQLFDRSRRQLQLTEAGRLVLGYASEIFRLGDEMVDALNDQHTAARVQVQIGATDMVPKPLTLRLYHQAQATFDCMVSLSEGHTDALLRELKAHSIDLVVANEPPPVGNAGGFYAKSIARMPVVICGHAKFANLRKGFPESLQDQPFIMPLLQSKLRHDLEHYLKLADIKVSLQAEVQDTSLQNLMCSYGDGVMALALPVAEEMVATKELIIIGALQSVYEELWLIAAHRRIQNPVAAAIMKDFRI